MDINEYLFIQRIFPYVGNTNSRILATQCTDTCPPKIYKFFKSANDTSIAFSSTVKYKRTWINYKIDMAYGKCCPFRKKMQTMDMEQGTNQRTS
jgi:hypothetical protein